MKVEVLVVTMNQKKGDYSLLDKMNIQTDAIVCNQCDRYEFEEFEWKKHHIRWLSFAERGVGLNRNNALMRSQADIVLFADDDIVYKDNYEDIILNSFLASKADVIVFNIEDPCGQRKQNRKDNKIRWYNYLRYGTVRIAARLDRIKLEGIFFNQCFGGGTKYSHGEDNLFLTDCLRKKLSIYANTNVIATLTEERKSTWRTQDMQKYLFDQGVLYKCISRKYWKLLCFQDALRNCKKYGMSSKSAYNIMISNK